MIDLLLIMLRGFCNTSPDDKPSLTIRCSYRTGQNDAEPIKTDHEIILTKRRDSDGSITYEVVSSFDDSSMSDIIQGREPNLEDITDYVGDGTIWAVEQVNKRYIV